METNSFLDRVQEKLQNILFPIADKINNQRHLSALKNGMMVTIPITIVGGIFMLIAQPPVNLATMQPTNIFFSFLIAWKQFAVDNASVLMVPYDWTIGALAVYIAFAIAYFLAKQYKINGMSAGISSMLIFLVIAAEPFTAGDFGKVISVKNLGGEGMFFAIIVAFITVEIFKFMLDHNIKIKLPDTVPPMVAAPFESLFPLVGSLLLFFFGNILCIQLTGNNLARLIFTILIPLMNATSSLPSVIILSTLLSLFWFLGIHANSIVGSVLTPIATANLALNSEAILSGGISASPLAGTFMTIFGNWMSYPAMLLCFVLVAKSAHLKSIRKLAIFPSMFNINEPSTFGVPIVMNVLLALPIMLCNIICCSVAYLVMDAGIVKSIYIAVPWTTPGIINVFLSTMDWKAVILWAGLFVLDVVILLPFVKAFDKQQLRQEIKS